MASVVSAKKAEVKKKGNVLRLEVYASDGVVVEVNGTTVPSSGPLDIDKMKAILGWQEEPEEGKWGANFKFRDATGKKVKLANVKANRPMRIGIAQRYCNEFLRGKWRFNGESFIIDSNGQFQDGQHRGVGFILAEQKRLKDPGKWKEYIGTKPITLDALIVRGVSPKDDVVDTLNIGQKRTLGDVLYRNHTIALARPKSFTDKELVVLSNILGGALRLVWMRVVNKAVNDAPHFPHSEAMDFLKNHKDLVRAVLQVYDYEGGKEKMISSAVTVAYAGALMYLMACSKTEPEKFMEEGVKVLDLSMWDKAKEFWSIFAGGKATASNPILRAKEIVRGLEAGSAQSREEIVRTIVKGWNLWIDGKTSVSKEAVAVQKQLNEEKQIMVLAEAPRIGGIDTDWSMYDLELVVEGDEGEGGDSESLNETIIDPETGDEIIRRKQKPKKKSKKGKGRSTHETGWSLGDTCWVLEGGVTWFGTIVKIHDDAVDVKAKDDGQTYTAAIKDISPNKPEDVEALEEEELEEGGFDPDEPDGSPGEDEEQPEEADEEEVVDEE